MVVVRRLATHARPRALDFGARRIRDTGGGTVLTYRKSGHRARELDLHQPKTPVVRFRHHVHVPAVTRRRQARRSSRVAAAQRRRRFNVTPASIVLAAPLVGVIVALISGLWLSSTDSRIVLLSALTAAVFTAQIAAFARQLQQAALQSTIDNATRFPAFGKALEASSDLYGRINGLKLPEEASDYLVRRFEESNFSDLRLSQLQIPPSVELQGNRKLLALARRTVRAVAYQDEDFWGDPEGKSFLKATADSIRRKVDTTRIWALSKDRLTNQLDHINEQKALGVECRVLILDGRSAEFIGSLEDFVIYDEYAVRRGTLPPVPSQGTGARPKRANLSLELGVVAAYLERYEELYELTEEV